MFEFANNESAFEALLESIKQASNNIKRDAGTRFETLIKDWLTQDQSYCDLFSKVETFEEWASSHPELAGILHEWTNLRQMVTLYDFVFKPLILEKSLYKQT